MNDRRPPARQMRKQILQAPSGSSASARPLQVVGEGWGAHNIELGPTVATPEARMVPFITSRGCRASRTPAGIRCAARGRRLLPSLPPLNPPPYTFFDDPPLDVGTRSPRGPRGVQYGPGSSRSTKGCTRAALDKPTGRRRKQHRSAAAAARGRGRRPRVQGTLFRSKPPFAARSVRRRAPDEWAGAGRWDVHRRGRRRHAPKGQAASERGPRRKASAKRIARAHLEARVREAATS